MTYFRVDQDDTFIGIGTTHDLRKYQEKHKILLTSTEDDAEYIQIDEMLYHDNWLNPIQTDRFEYQNADVTAIETDVYEALAESIELGEEILAEIEDETGDADSADDTAEDAVEAISKVGYLERLEALEEAVLELAEVVANG